MDERTSERLEGIGLRDHTVTAEYRIFGPPGTGKTTNLTRQIRRAVDRFGVGSVLVTSFSKATAAELAGRDTPIDLDRIGTLHSHCFHSLGRPAIAGVHVEDWNRKYPRLQITPVSRQVRLDGENAAEDYGQVKNGDCLLQQLNRHRGMMLEVGGWPATVRDFASMWTKYKSANRLLDFCDLIEVSLREVTAAPHHPSVLVVDEAQDLNRLQLTLIRRWSECARYLVLAGDDDQTIYAWAAPPRTRSWTPRSQTITKYF
jgi:superfamily I DNA/RNA helicase